MAKLEYFDPIDAIKIKQGDYTFYVFKMNSKDLLEISYTSERTRFNRTGIQRGLDRTRLREIGKYITQEKSDAPGILPNCIIVSFSKDTYHKNRKINIVRRKRGEAFILDGQHRLFAFDPEFSDGKHMDLIVTGFIELPEEMKAYIFRTINSEQKKINPSIVYDLIPMLRKDWIKFEDLRAQFLVEELNSDRGSPWHDGISMLGGRKKTITQASFITRIKRLLKKDNIFADEEFFEQSIQKDVLFEYFSAIREVFPVAWMNKKFILCKDVGVAATLNLLYQIIEDMRRKGKTISDKKGLKISKEDFIPYIKKIKNFSFASHEYGAVFLGEGGIRELTSKLQKMIFSK